MTVPNLATGDLISEAWVDAVANDLNALTDPWLSSWTPQIDQGGTLNIAKTVNRARHVKVGRFVYCHWFLSITGAGTAGAELQLSLPVTAAHLQAVNGGCWFYDASTTTRYVGSVLGASTTRLCFTTQVSAANTWGVNPSVAVASGDSWWGWAIFESAA